MIHLPIIPTDAITSVDEYFACPHLSAKLRVAACLQRQGEHGLRVSVNGNRERSLVQRRRGSKQGTRRLNMGRCGDCELGRSIVAKVSQ